MPRRRGSADRFCPVCGQKVIGFERKRSGSNVYWYAVHYLGSEGGRQRRKKCYLGPDLYLYVDGTFNPLGLQGALHEGRFMDYVTRALEHAFLYATSWRRKPEERLSLLQQLLAAVRHYADEVSREIEHVKREVEAEKETEVEEVSE